MKDDILNQLWDQQNDNKNPFNAEEIKAKAKKQRQGQYISITVMGITVIILVAFTLYFASNYWNNFTKGLVLMISSLTLRIILEFITIYRKESRLISMASKTYQTYLKSHYQKRLLINYWVTPICFIVYSYGFYMLLPFFKQEFSSGFYNYILISGILSILVIMVIVFRSIVKERHFLNNLK